MIDLFLFVICIFFVMFVYNEEIMYLIYMIYDIYIDKNNNCFVLLVDFFYDLVMVCIY